MNFYFAWVGAGVAFSPETHAVKDLVPFSFTVSHQEGEAAHLALEILNDREGPGLLSGAHGDWAFLSWDNGAGPEPLFYGRLLGIPSGVQGEVITIEFDARPLDIDAQKAALFLANQVDPWWDPVCVPPDRRDDPDYLLETLPSAWATDRVTHVVSISDKLLGEDGTLTFGATTFYDSLKIDVGTSPALRVDCTAEFKWVQAGGGSVDISDAVVAAAAAQCGAAYPGVISSITGEGLMKSWPQPGTAFSGGGWKVGSSSVARADGIGVNTLLVNVPVRTGGLTGAVTTADTDAAPDYSYYGSGSDYVGKPTITQFPVWNLYIQLSADYEASRQRVETVKFSVLADVQQVVSENADPLLTINVTSGEVDQPIDPGGALPLYDLRRDSYLLTERGRRSLRYLIATARSRLLARARTVRVSFEDTFEAVVAVSLRKSAAISDPRIPGDAAQGKIVSYSLSFDGGSGEMKGAVTIGCAIGIGGALTVPESVVTYVDGGVLDPGIQAMIAGGTLVAADLYYEGIDATPIATDGIDLLNPSAATMIDAITVVNGYNQQVGLLLGSRTTGDAVGYFVANPYPKGATSIAIFGGTGSFISGDIVMIGGHFHKYVASGGGSGTVTLSGSGLLSPISSGVPITVYVGPQYWSDTNEVAEAVNGLYTQIRVEMKPVTGTEALQTPFNIVTSPLMVPRMIDLDAV